MIIAGHDEHDERNTLYLSKIKTLIFFQHVQLGLAYFSNISMLWYSLYVLKRNNNENETNKQKQTTTLGGPSCWIIKHEITNWFLGRLFLKFFSLFVFLFVFSLSFLFSSFFFLSFLFFSEYWGGPSRPCRPACYAPALNGHCQVPWNLESHLCHVLISNWTLWGQLSLHSFLGMLLACTNLTLSNFEEWTWNHNATLILACCSPLCRFALWTPLASFMVTARARGGATCISGWISSA